MRQPCEDARKGAKREGTSFGHSDPCQQERHFCLLWRGERGKGGRLARNILRSEDCGVQWDGLHLTPGS